MESAPAGIGFEPWRFRLRGSVDPAALRAAWDDVLARHEVLRSAYAADGLPEPVQVIVRGVRPEWHEEDWRDLSREEQEARSRALESTERAHRFDLARPPLTRLTLVRLEDEVWELVWSTHHLHVDGWSWPLVFRDLSALYESWRGASPPAAAGLRVRRRSGGSATRRRIRKRSGDGPWLASPARLASCRRRDPSPAIAMILSASSRRACRPRRRAPFTRWPAAESSR
jgi:hypothetical protein